MNLRPFPSFLALLLLSGCGGSDDVGRKEESQVPRDSSKNTPVSASPGDRRPFRSVAGSWSSKAEGARSLRLDIAPDGAYVLQIRMSFAGRSRISESQDGQLRDDGPAFRAKVVPAVPGSMLESLGSWSLTGSGDALSLVGADHSKHPLTRNAIRGFDHSDRSRN